MRIQSIIGAGAYLARFLVSVFAVWLTLDWNVRKARKAFEKQLVRQGMTKRDARRISAQFSRLKNEVMSTLKASAFRSR